MIEKSGRRRTGIVLCQPGHYRTLGSGHLSSERYQSIDIPQIVPADRQMLSNLFIPMRLLFPELDWDDWGIEVVEGHDRLVEILQEEFTCLIDRRVLTEWPLLAWELVRTFLVTSLDTHYRHHLHPAESERLAFAVQLAWFAHERQSWQTALLDNLQKHATQAEKLISMLLSVVSPTRANLLRRSCCLPPLPNFSEDVRSHSSTTNVPIFWEQAAKFPVSALPAQNEATPSPTASFSERWQRFQRSFAIRSPLPWSAFSGPLLGIVFRYTCDVDPHANSTHRRLSLFRIVLEQQQELDEPYWRLAGQDWTQTSTLILDPQRHPKISCALLQFLETTQERTALALWPIGHDEYTLAQLSSQNRLGEEDDRFFRQATHLQAIWRDILHRTSSQDWSADLLFDALERTTCRLRAEPELIFLALISNRSMWESSTSAQNVLLRNLRELLWILSQAPVVVLRRLFPHDLKDYEKSQQRWPMLRRYIKRFLHLAPPILARHFDQLDEVLPLQTPPVQAEHPFQLDTDPDVQHQELHGRILPLLARPELRDYPQLRFDQVQVLRIVSLDKHLSQSSGLWRDNRFFRNFILFFKTKQNLHEGNWFHLALWLDKEIDLTKLAQKGEVPSTVSCLLQEEGIWEQTYRYQFLTVDQLMHRLRIHISHWPNILRLLGEEYEDLLHLRLREVLDYHFYLHRFQHPHQANTEPASSLWQVSVETFEVLKTQWVQEMVCLILADFYRMHLHDSCSWLAAEQNINQILHDVMELHTLDLDRLLNPPVYASPTHRSVASILQTWQDFHQPVESFSRKDMEEAWVVDKCSLLQRLTQFYPTQAILWTKHLLRLFERDYKIVEWMVSSPLEESQAIRLFKPLGNFQGPPETRGEIVPFLRDSTGALASPVFLRILSKIPIPLIRQALEQTPDLFPALQRAVRLLRHLDRDGEQHLQLWNTLEDLRQISQSAQQSNKKPSSNDMSRPEGSSIPD